MEASRFDYVKYDFASQKHQDIAKTQVIYLEKFIETFAPGENRANAIKALEECYMWIGKVIRDDQIKRNKEFELQEERTNG